MSKLDEQNLWKIINSPIVLVVLTVFLLSASAVITPRFTIANVKKEIVKTTGDLTKAFTKGFSQIADKQELESLEKVSVRNKLEIKNVKPIYTEWPWHEKIIGTFVNNSDKMIKSISVTASFYGNTGELIDVEDKWIYSEVVVPGQSFDFNFDRSLGDSQEPKEVLDSRKASSIKIVVKEFNIVHEGQEAKK